VTIEQMKWLLFKLYPLGDWQANVDSWDDARVRRVYLWHLSRGKIKTSAQYDKEHRERLAQKLELV
jgi:hypothetical protein